MLEVLKGVTAYHKACRAAFRHADRYRVKKVRQPTFCIASEDDSLSAGVDVAAALVPDAGKAILPASTSPWGLAVEPRAIPGRTRGGLSPR